MTDITLERRTSDNYAPDNPFKDAKVRSRFFGPTPECQQWLDEHPEEAAKADGYVPQTFIPFGPEKLKEMAKMTSPDRPARHLDTSDRPGDMQALSYVAVEQDWTHGGGHTKGGLVFYRRSAGPPDTYPGQEIRVVSHLPRLPVNKNDRLHVNWIIFWRHVGGKPEIMSVVDLNTFDPVRDNDYVEEVMKPIKEAIKPIEDRINEAHAETVANRPASEFDTFDKADGQTKPATKRPPEKSGAAPYIRNHVKKHYHVEGEALNNKLKDIFEGMSPEMFISESGVPRTYVVLDAYDAKHLAANGEPIMTEPAANERKSTPSEAQNGQVATTGATTPVGDEPAKTDGKTTAETGKGEASVADMVTGEIMPDPEPTLPPEPSKEIILFDARRALEHVMSTSDLINTMMKRELLVESRKDDKGNEVDGDYGRIAGSKKPALFKSGAEKLCEAFGLRPEFVLLPDSVIDWTSGFFYFHYRCELYRISTGEKVATANGSCNSKEDKYGWRWVEKDKVPARYTLADLETRPSRIRAFQFAVDEGKTDGAYGKPVEYWDAFRTAIANGKAAAVKMSTKNGDKPGWEIDATTYRIPNADVFSIVNTLDKMSQKRALVAATLIGTAASRFFTQDIEELTDYGTLAA